MKHFLNNKDKKLYYSDLGKGTVIVLLHGYLESLEIWEEFALKLSKSYRVICFDIPGHGKSDELAETHTIELLAETIFNSLKELNIEKCFMIGHSMGGYITLMFHKLFSEMLYGFSLFHSHPFADTEETKKKRLREIAFVKAGKKDLIAGRKDNYIDYNTVIPKIKLPKNSELKVLENSGHMGFIEEMEVSLRMIEEFVKNKSQA